MSRGRIVFGKKTNTAMLRGTHVLFRNPSIQAPAEIKVTVLFPADVPAGRLFRAKTRAMTCQRHGAIYKQCMDMQCSRWGSLIDTSHLARVGWAPALVVACFVQLLRCDPLKGHLASEPTWRHGQWPMTCIFLSDYSGNQSKGKFLWFEFWPRTA